MDFEVAFKIAVTVVGGVLGWFARELWGAVKALQSDLKNLEVGLPKSYVAKSDFTDAMKEIRQGLEKIYDKLDGKADK